MKRLLASILTCFVISLALLPLSSKAGEPTGQAIGFYSKGKLKNPSALSLESPGLVHLFQTRQRHFGSQGLIEIIEKSATQFFEWDTSSERLQVGDIAAKHGGKIARHASHQNGLDVDLVYFRTNHQEQSPDQTSGFEEKFVTASGSVTSNFDTQRNWHFLQLLIESGRVDRIFVDPAIKREFCAFAQANPELDSVPALSHLRPYPNHADHWHIRLTCPASSPRCVPQKPVPTDDGCPTIQTDFLNAALIEVGD